MEYALYALALALVASLGAWLEWHSRRTEGNTRERLVLMERALDQHATAILTMQDYIKSLEQQCASACAMAEDAKGVALEAALTRVAKRK